MAPPPSTAAPVVPASKADGEERKLAADRAAAGRNAAANAAASKCRPRRPLEAAAVAAVAASRASESNAAEGTDSTEIDFLAPQWPADAKEAPHQGDHDRHSRESPTSPRTVESAEADSLTIKRQDSKRATVKADLNNRWAVLQAETRKSGIAELADQVSCLLRVVSSKYWDFGVTMVVLISAVNAGAQVDSEARNGMMGKVQVFDYLDVSCTAIFTVELILRIIAFGMQLLSPKERWMFAVDLFLVLLGWTDFSLTVAFASSSAGSSATIGKMLRVVRIGRVLRLLRTARSLVELRIMGSMIISSFRSIFWLLVILVVDSYCFALMLTQGTTVYLQSKDSWDAAPEIIEDLHTTFGSLPASMYALFKSMTGGRNWGEIADLASNTGETYRFLVMIYVFIHLFSVLNIVTGVFVDGAIELMKGDRIMMIQKDLKKREASANHLLYLLQEIDESGDGVITRDEFLDSMDRKRDVREFMDALNIDNDDVDGLFELLDRDMDGVVDVVEFVRGMERLKGEAKAADIQMLIMRSQRIEHMLLTLLAPKHSQRRASLRNSPLPLRRGSSLLSNYARKAAGHRSENSRGFRFSEDQAPEDVHSEALPVPQKTASPPLMDVPDSEVDDNPGQKGFLLTL